MVDHRVERVEGELVGVRVGRDRSVLIGPPGESGGGAHRPRLVDLQLFAVEPANGALGGIHRFTVAVSPYGCAIRNGLHIIGIVVALCGVLFTLQGVGVVLGRTVLGPMIAVVGAALALFNRPGR